MRYSELFNFFDDCVVAYAVFIGEVILDVNILMPLIIIRLF